MSIITCERCGRVVQQTLCRGLCPQCAAPTATVDDVVSLRSQLAAAEADAGAAQGRVAELEDIASTMDGDCQHCLNLERRLAAAETAVVDLWVHGHGEYSLDTQHLAVELRKRDAKAARARRRARAGEGT